jgi:hypothetical protein
MTADPNDPDPPTDPPAPPPVVTFDEIMEGEDQWERDPEIQPPSNRDAPRHTDIVIEGVPAKEPDRYA